MLLFGLCSCFISSAVSIFTPTMPQIGPRYWGEYNLEHWPGLVTVDQALPLKNLWPRQTGAIFHSCLPPAKENDFRGGRAGLGRLFLHQAGCKAMEGEMIWAAAELSHTQHQYLHCWLLQSKNPIPLLREASNTKSHEAMDIFRCTLRPPPPSNLRSKKNRCRFCAFPEKNLKLLPIFCRLDFCQKFIHSADFKRP